MGFEETVLTQIGLAVNILLQANNPYQGCLCNIIFSYHSIQNRILFYLAGRLVWEGSFSVLSARFPGDTCQM